MKRSPFWFLLLSFSAASGFAHEMRPIPAASASSCQHLRGPLESPCARRQSAASPLRSVTAALLSIEETAWVLLGGAYTERWTVQCDGGLPGKTIRIDGLTATLTDVLVRIERLDGSTQVTRSHPPRRHLSLRPHHTEWKWRELI